MRIRTYKGEDDLNREIEYRDALNRIVRRSVIHIAFSGLRIQTRLQWEFLERIKAPSSEVLDVSSLESQIS